MSAISRRDFCKIAATQAAAVGLLSTGALELRANPLGLPIGCQTWPVRDMIAKDFPGTLKAAGGRRVSDASNCARPSDMPTPGFAGLAKYKGAELEKILNDAGVTCVSSHFGIDELRKNQDDRIAWAKDVGLTQMLVPSLMVRRIRRWTT